MTRTRSTVRALLLTLAAALVAAPSMGQQVTNNMSGLGRPVQGGPQ